MNELEWNIYYAKNAAYILSQNGTVYSDRYAAAIEGLISHIQALEIQMSEMEMKKS